jgi:hypothetical protein
LKTVQDLLTSRGRDDVDADGTEETFWQLVRRNKIVTIATALIALSLVATAAMPTANTNSSGSGSESLSGDYSGDDGSDSDAGGVDVSAAEGTARSVCGSVSWEELARQFGGETLEGAASAFVSESFVASVQPQTYEACIEVLH